MKADVVTMGVGDAHELVEWHRLNAQFLVQLPMERIAFGFPRFDMDSREVL